MAGKIPVTVITGFLGAGKTTLIRNLIERADGRRIALIVNEFGDLGVDGEIVKGCGIEGCADEDVVELSNGCICCTVAEDFLPALQGLMDRSEPPEHIVIETSGLALPQPLVRALGWPDVRTKVTVDGVVTVVDGPALARGQFAHDEKAIEAQRLADDALDHATPLSELFEDQLACADMVVVNKTDLLEAGQPDALKERLLTELRGGVMVVETEHGRLSPSVLLGMDASAEDDLGSRHEVHHHHQDDHHHDHEHDHGHDHHHDHGHDAFASFVLDLPEQATANDLPRLVERVMERHGLLRVKGFAAVAGRPMRQVVQAVGPRVDSYFDRPFAVGEARTSRLVVIGLDGLDKAAIAADFEAVSA